MTITIPLFPVGKVFITQSANRALHAANRTPQEFLDRHANGDWEAWENEEEEDIATIVAKGQPIYTSFHLTERHILEFTTSADRDRTIIELYDLDDD